MAKDEETVASSLSLASSEGEAFTTERSSSSGSSRPDKGKQRAAVQDEEAAAVPEAPSARTTPRSLHAVAGGLGGLAGGIVTAPFDVVKTRLQSNLFTVPPNSSSSAAQSLSSAPSKVAAPPNFARAFAGTRRLLYHLVETGIILRDIGKNEGLPALFRGVGPTLVGVIPARSINFFSYGNGKQLYAQALNNGKESAYIHLISAATAGIITATATNPIWVVKTRLQLQDSMNKPKGSAAPIPAGTSPTAAARTALPSTAAGKAIRSSAAFSSVAHDSTLFTPSFARQQATLAAATSAGAQERASGSLQCIAQIWQREGLKGFYRGMSASYLGVAEGTIQWTLYEQFKTMRKKSGRVREEGWMDKVGAAGAAKLIATIITYPHEVVRTRLRQAPPAGSEKAKYHGLWQTFSLVWKEEGMVALYGGLSPHLLRVVPNAAVMYSIYELVLKYGSSTPMAK